MPKRSEDRASVEEWISPLSIFGSRPGIRARSHHDGTVRESSESLELVEVVSKDDKFKNCTYSATDYLFDNLKKRLAGEVTALRIGHLS